MLLIGTLVFGTVNIYLGYAGSIVNLIAGCFGFFTAGVQATKYL